MPGFRNPPPGYGEVPFWWWTGEELDAERLVWQLRELHKKGISGVQVNYSHYDTRGWPTENDDPDLFTEEWWEIYSRVSEECGKLGMGIGLSTYTLDWPRGGENLFKRLFYDKPELNAVGLAKGPVVDFEGRETKRLRIGANTFAVWAYRRNGAELGKGGIDLTESVVDGELVWTAPQGRWQVWTFAANRHGGSLNPLMKKAGETVIRGFYQKFEDHNPGRSSKGLNYFFNDELHIGLGWNAWNPDFPEEFERRKGYDLMEVLPAMWVEMGDATPKVRMDYADVRMSLMEERYFEPIHEWHWSRGMIFGCDSGGRGKAPDEFGDYFRATRWYTAPGHDTPGGKANLIKGKVSSSIANLYRRPRVWLEGYHSLGWGATPANLMYATRENYLYGCTLLNLHGLYYSTCGSHWEWAPPCYHFRMPYWEHMGVFLRYFDRLSYLMSQGAHVCDVAVIYPVAPYEAKMNGKAARDTAFDLAHRLMDAGINFEFIDNDSLARAAVKDGRLIVEAAGASYQALVFPAMEAVRRESISKGAEFAEAGGLVIPVGPLPSVSDRAGRNDPQLEEWNRRAFKPACRADKPGKAVELIRKAFVPDVRGLDGTVRALHRRIGPREVYLVMDAEPGHRVEFRARGAVELWDPWTGETHPLRKVRETDKGTQVELPLEKYEAQVVVFTPGRDHVDPPGPDNRTRRRKTLSGKWTVSFVPTMNNTCGDFRLPVTPANEVIGVEARRFTWTRGTMEQGAAAMPAGAGNGKGEKKLHGHGTQFYVLGPVPQEVETGALDKRLAALEKVDPSRPVRVPGRELHWRPYDISWRYGKEGDLGHQGYHGLKRTVTDDFLCLGKKTGGLNETRYVDPKGGGRYYLWTSATVPEPLAAEILVSQGPPAGRSHTSPVLTPAAVYVNGRRVENLSEAVALHEGANPVLVRYDRAGRGHFVMRRHDRPPPRKRERLAMRWSNDAGVIPFDVYAGDRAPEWFRFVSAPGTRAINVNALGEVRAWINGEPMTDRGGGRFEAAAPVKEAAVVALRVMPDTGRTGGGVIPEPVAIETGTGAMPLGDWSAMGILHNYSGGVRYRKSIELAAAEADGEAILDLGEVVATAEVRVNGKKAGVRVAPPWQVDVTGLLREGENVIEVLVFNTLANHYQTIPSRYRGTPTSGLMGPVVLVTRE